ncbi:vWA-MoxR associated protein middle region 2 domain-containing protein OS=Streptomyces griseomycini OX=66895 GN=FHS37_007767 PE=4 SV=1 [Streptomyces griseomycini]
MLPRMHGVTGTVSSVLALLGHGEGAEGAPLHFVTSGMEGAPRLSNVDVSSLLGDVLNHPGLAGLITIVDTCLAGGAVPATPMVTAGPQAGNVRFSLLFGATAKEAAYRLRLSKTLIRLIEEGLPDAGEFLRVDDDLMEQLREQISGQQPGRCIFDGAPFFGDVLWLARNRAASYSHELGPIASKAVRDAVRRIDSTLQLSTEGEIAAWLKENQQTAGVGSRLAVHRLHEVLDELAVSRKTLNVANKVFGPHLTEDDLLLAGMLAGLPLHLLRREAPPNLRDLVEYAAHHGGAAEGQHRALAHLAAAMTHVAGCGDTLPEEVVIWAQDFGLTPMVNSRLRELNHQSHPDRAPRLVLVLADDGGESVVRVDAWLLFGRAVLGSQRFPCSPGEKGLKTALAQAVAWSGPWANLAGKRLKYIDVAAPTLVLLDCPPEEQVFRKQMTLGVNYTVTTRWSGLLAPPHGTTVDDMLQVGEELLVSLDDSKCSGPDWLHADQMGTVEQVQKHLSNHGFGQRVWAVASLPTTDWDFIAQELLEHTPALVWPRQKDVSDKQKLKASVGKYWRALPLHVAQAYQQDLSGDLSHDDELGPLAAVRVAWHDKDWQAFCRRRASTVLRAPDEMMYKEQA